MKALYKWLQEEVLNGLQILEDGHTKDEPNKTVSSGSKAYLTNCRKTLENLLGVMDKTDLDTVKAIGIIAKLKSEKTGIAEEKISSEMTWELLNLSIGDSKDGGVG